VKIISIPGGTTAITPDDKPSIAVFGEHNVGKTRFGLSLPSEEGAIGVVCVDKNSKRTLMMELQRMQASGKPVPQVVVNEKPFITDAQLMAMQRLDLWADDKDKRAEDQERVKKMYDQITRSIYEWTYTLTSHRDVESILVDTATDINNFLFLAHFGRTSQIQPTSRTGPNQEFINYINSLRPKNSVLVFRSADIWVDTGKVNPTTNEPIQKPSGKHRP